MMTARTKVASNGGFLADGWASPSTPTPCLTRIWPWLRRWGSCPQFLGQASRSCAGLLPFLMYRAVILARFGSPMRRPIRRTGPLSLMGAELARESAMADRHKRLANAWKTHVPPRTELRRSVRVGPMNKATGTDTLDGRIAAAFVDALKSEDVASLLAETEAALIAAGEEAERSRVRALDPVLSALDVATARRHMDDAVFRHDPLQSAVTQLRDRLPEVRAHEEDQRRQLAYDKARVERDMSPAVFRLANIMAHIDASDREIRQVNATLPQGRMPLLSAMGRATPCNRIHYPIGSKAPYPICASS